MALSNYERMIQLSDDVFSSRTDPDQLNVNENVMEHLQLIHPDTMSEYDNGNGPVCWILCIPTTLDLMTKFVNQNISEKELYDLTPLNTKYEAIYLCSALLLEEFRGQGIATYMLRYGLEFMRQRGEDRIFISCHHENEASRRVIEKCGGEFAGLVVHPYDNDEPYRTYWIPTSA